MNTEISVVIGKRLREIRTHRNWTQEHMAEILDLDSNYYATVERGEKLFSLSKFANVLELLELSANDLLPFSSRKKPVNTATYKSQIDEILEHFSESQYITAIKILRAIDEISNE
jgi:transcriptional regulator with XRE-family HTH domain